jgi:hypothetical protein
MTTLLGQNIAKHISLSDKETEQFCSLCKPLFSADVLIAALKAKYPSLIFDIALQIGAKVNTVKPILAGKPRTWQSRR